MSTIKRVRSRIMLETDTGAIIDTMFDTDQGNTIQEVLTGTLETAAEITALSNYGSLIQPAINAGVQRAMDRLLTPSEHSPAIVATHE